MLRRGPRVQAPRARRFSVGNLTVDLDARQVLDERNGLVALTSTEFDLLACFIQRPRRRADTRPGIGKSTRGRMPDPLDRASPGANLISTVRNGGYLLTAQVTPAS
jgi:two-component system OmpR family response regulator